MSASRSIFSIGMDRVITAPSAPSASTQAPSDFKPTSLTKVAKETPVHSEVLSRPCVNCTVLPFAPVHSEFVLPEHSIKCFRDKEGMRFMSSIVNRFGAATRP